MDVFDLHEQLISDYGAYTQSFIRIADERIRKEVNAEVAAGLLWPDPLLQLNPNFESGATISELVSAGTLHSDCDRIFRIKAHENDLGDPMTLYRHQSEAIEVARQGHPYVLTTGTGSGKSLSYIVPIVDHVLRHGSGRGIQAIIVYPMNALANSQQEELAKFLDWGLGGEKLVTYERYTGQESDETRQRIIDDPPDILLTNYVMLELILTRIHEQRLVQAASDTRFLVFDELHTYRGRQGADVGMLVRRCRDAFSGEQLMCVGTSATMASGEDLDSVGQRAKVAEVASLMFGQNVGPDHVIGETLRRTTLERDFNEAVELKSLQSAVKSPVNTTDFDVLVDDPFSSWIESTVGMTREATTEKLIRQEPASIEGEDGLASRLAGLAGVGDEEAARAIMDRLRLGAQARREGSGSPLFAFKLHQFITRGDTAWASIETEDDRSITLKSGERFKPGDDSTRLYPLCFCRECGQAYYRVDQVQDPDGVQMLPRDRFEQTVDDDTQSGYLYLSETTPWPDSNDSDEVLSRLPEDWCEEGASGLRVKSSRRKRVPTLLRIGRDGRPASSGTPAAWIPAPFMFCLNPECGVSYNARQRSDRGKLATLGVDGRSTATSVLSLAVLMDLAANESLEKPARKLLSFTDNRQDASLQAGHFNDFVEVSMVRSGLHRALESAGDEGCRHSELPQRVFTELDLPLSLYAEADLRGPARRQAESALRLVLEYFAYRDLQRGWRVTSPNLEQCGLLKIEYDGVEELVDDDSVWNAELHDSLVSASKDLRREILVAFLDQLRRSLAIKHECLEQIGQERIVNESRSRLTELWRFEDPKELARAAIAWPGSRPAKGGGAEDLFVSPQSNYGMFLSRKLGGLSLDDRAVVIDQIFEMLRPWGLIDEVRERREDGRKGYQVRADAFIWRSADGSQPMVDPLRVESSSTAEHGANKYFIDFYRRFSEFAGLFEAREHTAQVPAAIREDREDRFRSADLPLMFCSPTMELGIDISQLNVVNLRNVPPTPANYAQRSGRAGRPGRKSQPALVFTYCSGFSPHDQYYFRRPKAMVAGSVTAPRLDLANEDLARSHVHAIWLSAAGLDLGKTLTDILDVSEENLALPLKELVLAKLEDASIQGRALVRAKLVLQAVPGIAEAGWWREDWVDDVLGKVAQTFNGACDRWRSLYRAAVQQRSIQNEIIGDHGRSEQDRRTAKRLRAQAESQINLLTDARNAMEGDFYSYRYFASEGFLPGYNFPRLPISAFIPARRETKGRDEFLSRPRFLAVSEFGPKAIIYHEGSQYEIHKVNIALDEDGEGLARTGIKICGSCGYGHLVDSGNSADVCEACSTPFAAEDEIHDLVRMQNVSARRRHRITSDEEERRRVGYDVRSTLQFEKTDGRLDMFTGRIDDGDTEVGVLQYGDAARIYRINLGWNRRGKDAPPGFVLDLERGFWAKNDALPSEEQDQDNPDLSTSTARVIPYVEDRRNALVLRLEATPDAATMASLQSALKEAIQHEYQLEGSELAADPLPSRDSRQAIFIFESAEGGAGVLRQLVQDPQAMARVARRAMEICHLDPVTGDDTDGPGVCTAACYECLLDYGNQRDHEILDRRLIRGLLQQLGRSSVTPLGRPVSRGDLFQKMWDACDSNLERTWLKMVEEHGFVPPTDAQKRLADAGTKPDFYYADHSTAIYVDGPPHDDSDVQAQDAEVESRLSAAGYQSIRFHHEADWLEILRQYPDIFGPGREIS